MLTTKTVVALAALAMVVVMLLQRRVVEGFEPVGTCWKDVEDTFEVKRILWAAQTLAWRITGHLLTHHADSPYTRDLLRKSKLELKLPTTFGNDDIVKFDAATGCVALDLHHPAMQRLPDSTMKKKMADVTPEEKQRLRAYTTNVTKAVVHALASVHGRVGTDAHNKAYEFYATVMVNEMAGPKHLLTQLATTTTSTKPSAKQQTKPSGNPRRCSSAKNPVKFAECCASKALRDQVDDACTKPFTF